MEKAGFFPFWIFQYACLAVGDTGLEPVDVTSFQNKDLRKPAIQSGAESGALGAQFSNFPPDLQEVVAAWGSLPETIRQAIMAMVKKAE